ncbi:MAG: hypothetical protein MUE99_01815 [Chitinophagaceae bacterium]|nr:hypothetical protein [Chitinophagaceae bacterium]
MVNQGAGQSWVAGTYDDPSNAVALRIVQNGDPGTIKITQAVSWPDVWGKPQYPPTFDLALGKGQPYALSMDMGAGEATADLGGLPLTQLTINFGAGKQVVDFSAPNPQPLERIKVAAGAASLELKNLANANFAEMIVEGGAAAYVFDFGGQLRRDAAFKITAGMAAVEIHLPASTAAKVVTETVLGSIDMSDGFMKKDGAFWNEAALFGATPVLTITASVVMGSIRLVTTPGVAPTGKQPATDVQVSKVTAEVVQP